MFMYVKSKKVAFLGLTMALSVILVILSGIIEMNTLFLLAVASCFTGMAITEYGIVAGAAYMTGSVLLSFILAPNKLYVFTYAGMCLYLILTEFVWKVILKCEYKKRNQWILAILKAVIFNAMYIPMLIWLPTLFIARKMSVTLFGILLIAGQAVLILYDMAYHYFMNRYWLKIRRMINN